MRAEKRMASAKSKEEHPLGFSQITSHAIRQSLNTFRLVNQRAGFMRRAGFQRFLG
jgi:hypothetical protein